MNVKDLYTEDAMQASLAFMVSQASHIETAVNEALYPEIQYPGLIPVDTSAHPFAKTVTYYSSDKFGQAEWLNGNSDDIPVAGTKRQQHQTSIHMAGVGYTFGFEEVGQATMLGYNLQSDDAMAARRASEEMIDDVALFGAPEKGFNGLVNHPDVTVANVANGNWANANEYDIIADINRSLLGIGTDTNYVIMADTLLMDYTKYNLLATRAFGNDGTITIMEFVKKFNTYTAQTGQPLTIRAVRGLDNVGVAGTSRLIAYKRSPDVMKFHMTMPHRFLPVHRDGVLNYVVPGVFRIGGLDIRRPQAVRYEDGI